METLSPDTDGAGANPSSVKSDDSTPPHEGGRGSPPPHCAICLGTCRNKCFTDSCLHQFCFKCLLTWSKVKAECPLCKQNFKSIIHNVRSNHQYEEYMVEQRQTAGSPDPAIDLSNVTRRFRYRTTLTLPRRDTLAIQHLLMHYPMMAGVLGAGAERAPERRRREPATFRRTVYRHNLWARPLPDFTGRYRDCSPDFYRRNDSQMHRLVPWLSRELHYLLNENAGHISYVLARILELLPRVPINSVEFAEAMRRYFGERTEHFLHELYCFASTPYDMTGYDRQVQYTTDTRISTVVNEVISSTDTDSGDSDIVMVSASEPAPGPGPSRPAPHVVPIETVSRSDDDDDEEVVVVGYIKPPAERTPEVVDLLGSDSDVVVHEPEPAPAPAPAPERLVKLSLTRRRAPAPSDSDDSSYVPPEPRPRPSRRRRRSALSDTSRTSRTSRTSHTSDTSRLTPSPPRAPSPAPSATLSPEPKPEPAAKPEPVPKPEPEPEPESSSSSSSSDSEDRRRRSSKRARRKTSRQPERSRKRSKRSRSRRAAERTERAERPGRKSHQGKGVKSSRRAAASEPSAGPSAERNASSTRRLRSVVNVIPKPSSDSGSSGNINLLNVLSDAILKPNSGVLTYSGDGEELLRRADSCFRPSSPSPSPSPSDPEDDLPLNLSVPRARPL